MEVEGIAEVGGGLRFCSGMVALDAKEKKALRVQPCWSVRGEDRTVSVYGAYSGVLELWWGGGGHVEILGDFYLSIAKTHFPLDSRGMADTRA